MFIIFSLIMILSLIIILLTRGERGFRLFISTIILMVFCLILSCFSFFRITTESTDVGTYKLVSYDEYKNLGIGSNNDIEFIFKTKNGDGYRVTPNNDNKVISNSTSPKTVAIKEKKYINLFSGKIGTEKIYTFE